MNSTPRQSIVEKRFGTAATAALWLLGAVAFSLSSGAGEALAACGDYVMVGGQHPHAMLEPDANHATPLLPLTRCQGPNCQRQVPLPTTPWRDLPKLSSIDRACLLAAFQAPSFSEEWLSLATECSPLDGCRRDIEHPPRLVA